MLPISPKRDFQPEEWHSTLHCIFLSNRKTKTLGLRLEPPYTGVPRPSGPETPKKFQKGVPGPAGPECPKSVKESQVTQKRVKKTTTSVFGDFFRHFFDFDTPGGEAREVLLRLFGDFGPRGPRDSCI